MSFESYTDCLLRAYKTHTKPAEILKRKKEILEEIAEFHNFTPNKVLYVGFNPAMLVDTTKDIWLTHASQDARDFLAKNNIRFSYISEDKLSSYSKQFDCVIALDEYFTFAKNDNAQRLQVQEICSLAREYVITTCKDYKNQDFKDREFSIPALVRNSQSTEIFLEFHDHDNVDRNSWKTMVYQISNQSLIFSEPFARRAMFFKQLAKFSHDAGATGFNVHKNLMYKSLIKKNYEHVISIRFDNGS
jgi:hypothetical protein